LEARLSVFSDAVDRHMRQVLERAELPDDLVGMVSYHLGWVDEAFQPTDAPRGKRLRPALCLLVCEAAGGDWQAALPAAAAVELVHNFSLIHDDIEDDSPLRRHRPTLWAVWGVPRALNAGDTLLILAQLTVFGTDAVDQRQWTAARLLNRACVELCAGQHRDLSVAAATEPTLAGYLRMIEGKTAALLRVAAELGALAAGASEPQREAYGRFGRALGLAFQFQDDWLDVWGDAAATGKPAREDLRTRKHSLPFVLACERAPTPLRGRLRRVYAQDGPLDDAVVDDLVAVLNDLSVRAEAERLVRHHYDAALSALHAASPPPEGAALLECLAASLIGRQA
jgi:geranylgeranyl diphosphate synthase type I